MVNYDLPWNPNRLEQRFGRIHRIGQTEICHLWNLVADETREGDVYRRLLEKLEQAREALGGQVFDVLGKLQFEGKSLKDLLLEAIRYGEQPEVRDRLNTAVEGSLDQDMIRDLLDDEVLVQDVMDASRIQNIREEMERADARRLQPHFVESFFNVVRNRDRQIGMGEPVMTGYERIVFDKSLISPPGMPPAAFVYPGHPLLDATIDLTLERHRDLLKRGAVLVDENDTGTEPRVLFFLQHAITDASRTRSGVERVISKRVLNVEINEAGDTHDLHYAPYLDYRPLEPEDASVDDLLTDPSCQWVTKNVASRNRILVSPSEHTG